MKNLLKKGLLFLIFPLVSCQNSDLTTQISGAYQVHHLKVFDALIDTSQGFVAMVTVTKIDEFHVALSLDIHPQKEESSPIKTTCTAVYTQGKMQLAEAKTNQVLGYIEGTAIHLNSFDSKGAKTEIIGKL